MGRSMGTTRWAMLASLLSEDRESLGSKATSSPPRVFTQFYGNCASIKTQASSLALTVQQVEDRPIKSTLMHFSLLGRDRFGDFVGSTDP